MKVCCYVCVCEHDCQLVMSCLALVSLVPVVLRALGWRPVQNVAMLSSHSSVVPLLCCCCSAVYSLPSPPAAELFC